MEKNEKNPSLKGTGVLVGEKSSQASLNWKGLVPTQNIYSSTEVLLVTSRKTWVCERTVATLPATNVDKMSCCWRQASQPPGTTLPEGRAMWIPSMLCSSMDSQGHSEAGRKMFLQLPAVGIGVSRGCMRFWWIWLGQVGSFWALQKWKLS